MTNPVLTQHVEKTIPGGQSEVIRPVVRRVARTDSTVLLTGPTGVGKGRTARWIHEHSARSDRPFVPVNCGAIPDELIDSQLFGHVRGAFSGATRDHLGLVRAADGGTLLLDEVGELPAHAQRRLLRLLEEREVQPVGLDRQTSVNVRIIAATNRDLAEAVAAGRFREDLYFRLDVIRLAIEPLCERQAEIPQLVDTFNRQFAHQYDRAPLDFSDDVLSALEAHPWPGNIRQLKTVVERLHVLCEDQSVTLDDLKHWGQISPAGASSPQTLPTLSHARQRVAREALDACGGVVSDAAEALGVHRSTIYRWLDSAGRLSA